MRDKINAVLDEHVRPLLRGHGGDIEFLDVSGGMVRIRLTGNCAGCAAADLTTESLVKEELTQRIEGIRDVQLVRTINPDLLAQARDILRKRHET